MQLPDIPVDTSHETAESEGTGADDAVSNGRRSNQENSDGAMSDSSINDSRTKAQALKMSAAHRRNRRHLIELQALSGGAHRANTWAQIGV